MAKKKSSNIENLCTDEAPEICFEDNPKIKGKEVASFSFDDNSTSEDHPPITTSEKDIVSSKKAAATFKRSYYLTKNTIRKVDELKAKDPSLTTYVSTIVESAINYYYDYIMNIDNIEK